MYVVYWFTVPVRHGTGSLGHRVNRSFGSSFTSGSLGHWFIILTRCETRVFFRFSKKCPKCKTYIWNAQMTKVTVRCPLLDWNHWMSVHAMNFYFYLWLLKILWTEKFFGVHYRTSNRVKCDPVPCLVPVTNYIRPIQAMHGSESDIQIWWTRGWKCRMRAQLSMQMVQRQQVKLGV